MHSISEHTGGDNVNIPPVAQTKSTNVHSADELLTLWPNKNIMLRQGLFEVVSKIGNIEKLQNFFFIDFNINNLKMFLTTDWPRKFQGKKVILICDHRMLALANFWFSHPLYSHSISAIIFHTDHITTVEDKMSALFAGKIVSPPRGMPRLSFTEFIILQLYIQGVNTKQIAFQCNYGVKTVYTYKQRIEKKLKIRIPKSG